MALSARSKIARISLLNLWSSIVRSSHRRERGSVSQPPAGQLSAGDAITIAGAMSRLAHTLVSFARVQERGESRSRWHGNADPSPTLHENGYFREGSPRLISGQSCNAKARWH